jgi:hypothetical protein
MTAMTPSSPEYAIQQAAVEQYPPTLRVVRHLISFLQWRFSLLPVGAYHWQPEDQESVEGTKSEIYIAGDTPLPAQAIGERPAITVLRSQLQFQGVGIGDMAFHNLRTGGKTYMDLLPTTICINVLSRLAFVSERLAFFVQDQIFSLREEIVRNEKCILSLGPRTTMAPPSPAGSLIDSVESDWINVALYMPTYLQHSTSFTPINVPVLEKVDVKVRDLSVNLKKR